MSYLSAQTENKQNMSLVSGAIFHLHGINEKESGEGGAAGGNSCQAAITPKYSVPISILDVVFPLKNTTQDTSFTESLLEAAAEKKNTQCNISWTSMACVWCACYRNPLVGVSVIP